MVPSVDLVLTQALPLQVTPVTKKKIIFFPTCMDDIVSEVADKEKEVLVDNRYKVKGFCWLGFPARHTPGAVD
jgi:hypothetical protein